MQLLETPRPSAAEEQTRSSESGQESTAPNRSRVWRRYALAIACLILLALIALPTVISNSRLHSRLLSHNLEEGATATASSFSIGWFSPLVANGVQIQKKGEDKPVEVEKVEVPKSLFDIVRGKLKDATITLTKPKFRIELDDGGKSAGALFPKMRTRVVDGQLRVFQKDAKEPFVQLDGLNFISDVKSIKGGRQMSMTDMVILKRHKITPELTKRGLGLIAPMLANAADVEGEVTLHIDSIKVDRINDKSTLRELKGKLVLHDVKSTAGPVLSDMVDVLSHLRRQEFPKRLTVTRESTVFFEMENDRIYHDGFAFVLPEIAEDIEVMSRGSVGLDETIDITLSLLVPQSLATRLPIMEPLVGKPIELKVTGTVSEPIVGLPNNQNVADYIASRLVPTPNGEPEALPDAIVRLIGGVADRNKLPNARVGTLPGSIMNLIRSAREMRQQRLQNGQLPIRRRRPRRRRQPE